MGEKDVSSFYVTEHTGLKTIYELSILCNKCLKYIKTKFLLFAGNIIISIRTKISMYRRE